MNSVLARTPLLLDIQIAAVLWLCHKEKCVRLLRPWRDGKHFFHVKDRLYKYELWRGFKRTHTLRSNLSVRTLYKWGPRRKAFGPVLKKMTALGLQPFLIYPAVIKLQHKGEQRSFDSPQKAEDFVSSLSQREGLDGRDGHGPSCPVGEDGRVDMDAC